MKNVAGSAHTDGADAVADSTTGKRTRANAAGPLCDEVVVVGPRGFKGQTQLGQKKPHTGQQAPLKPTRKTQRVNRIANELRFVRLLRT